MFGHHPFSTHSIGDVAPRATFSSIFNVVLYIKRSTSIAKSIVTKFTQTLKKL